MFQINTITEKLETTMEGITYLFNPTKSELIGLLNRSKNEVRGIYVIDTNDIYIWNAYNYTHSYISSKLNINGPIIEFRIVGNKIYSNNPYGTWDTKYVQILKNSRLMDLGLQLFENMDNIMESTNSNNFKRWFGNSKIVDDSGNPLVVYHGTADNIDIFDDVWSGSTTENNKYGGFFFTNDKDVAQDYSRQAFIRRYDGSDLDDEELSIEDKQDIRSDINKAADRRIKVLGVYLRMEEPLIIDCHGDMVDVDLIMDLVGFVKKGVWSDSLFDYIDIYGQFKDSDISKYQQDIINAIKDNYDIDTDNIDVKDYPDIISQILYDENGIEPTYKHYDGIIMTNGIDSISELSNKVQNTYIVINPNQIKSVENNGEWSRTNNNIYENRRYNMKELIETLQCLLCENEIKGTYYDDEEYYVVIDDDGNIVSSVYDTEEDLLDDLGSRMDKFTGDASDVDITTFYGWQIKEMIRQGKIYESLNEDGMASAGTVGTSTGSTGMNTMAGTGVAPTPPIGQVTVNGQPWTTGKSYPAKKRRPKKKSTQKIKENRDLLQIEDFDDPFIYGADIYPTEDKDIFDVKLTAKDANGQVMPIYIAAGTITTDGWLFHPMVSALDLRNINPQKIKYIIDKYSDFTKTHNYDILTQQIADLVANSSLNKVSEAVDTEEQPYGTVKNDDEDLAAETFTYKGVTPKGKQYTGKVTFFPTAFGWQYSCSDKQLEDKNPQWSTITSKQNIIYWFRNELYALGCQRIEVGNQSWDVPEDQLIQVENEEEKEETYEYYSSTINKLNQLINEYFNDIKEDFDPLKQDARFRYMLLDRLRTDCNYFLGYGNRSEKNLWAGNVDEQIKTMKDLYNSFGEDKKPEWISMEDIENYEKQMKSTNESKINEISDKLANTVADFRKANAYDAKQRFRALDNEHTAELANIDKKYTNKQIFSGEADKDIDAVDAKYEPLENEQRKIIKKAEKNADLMAKRKLRLSNIKNESKINEISDTLKNKVAAIRQIDAEKASDEENEILRKYGPNSKQFKKARKNTVDKIKKLNKFGRKSNEIIGTKEYQQLGGKFEKPGVVKNIEENILTDQKAGQEMYAQDYKNAEKLFQQIKDMDKEEIIDMIPDPFGEKEYFQSLSKPQLIKTLLKKKFNKGGEDFCTRNKNLIGQ